MTRDRWHALMQRLGLPPCDEVHRALEAAYAEKHRRYHTAAHIRAMLRHLDDVRDRVQRPDALELAIWFHDAVYKTRSAHNERDSADWARDFLLHNGAQAELAEHVHGLIMATEHRSEVSSEDAGWMLDIDLSILGTEPSVYDAFERAVRAEYRWVPWFVYRKKRRAVLASFLHRSRIYHSEYFYSRLQQQARDNLVRAMNAL